MITDNPSHLTTEGAWLGTFFQTLTLYTTMDIRYNWKWLCLVGLMMLQPLLGAAQVNLDSGLVAYYPFNGNAEDESGNGNDGVVQGAILTTDDAGVIDQAYEFDGVDDWINAGDSPDLRMTDSTSMTFFGKIYLSDQLSDIGDIFRYDDLDNHDGDRLLDRATYLLRVTADRRLDVVFGNYAGDNRTRLETSQRLDSLKWYSVAFVRDVEQDSTFIFVDGESVASIEDRTVGSWETAGQYLMIGRFEDGQVFSHFFHGKMDELRVYRRALSPAEILELSQFNTTGLQRLNTSTISLAPNPAPGAFTLSSPQATLESVTLYDLTGRALSAEVSLHRHEAQVRSDYRGLLIVRVLTERGSWVGKVRME